MITLEPEVLAKQFLSGDVMCRDYSLRGVHEFIRTCDIATGTTPVTFGEISNYSYVLSEKVWDFVQQRVEGQVVIGKDDEPYEVILKITRHQSTQVVGVNVADLVKTLGFSGRKRAPLGITDAKLKDYECYKVGDNYYLPLPHLTRYLLNVINKTRFKAPKEMCALLLKSDFLHQLEHIQDAVQLGRNKFRERLLQKTFVTIRVK